MVVRILFRTMIFLLVIFINMVAFGSESQKVTIDIRAGLTKLNSNDWTIFGTGNGELDIRSKGAKNIKARLNIQMVLGNYSQPNTGLLLNENKEIFWVKYAYIKFRLPVTESYNIRFLTGKNSLTWGVGSFYNAANTVFGAEGTGAELLTIEGDLREETDWYTSIFIPVGRFGFIEPILLLPQPGIDESSTTVFSYPSIEETSFGTRLNTKLFNTQVEFSYLYRGINGEHNPAISLQGNIGPDIYLAISFKIYSNGNIIDDFSKNLIISGGLFWLNPFKTSKTLSIRLEGLLRPEGLWSEKYNSSLSDNSYGIELFPEIIFHPTDRTTLVFRQIFSPIDFSAVTIFGIDWESNQSLHLYNFLSFQLGENGDTYSPDSFGGIGIYAGIRYSY